MTIAECLRSISFNEIEEILWDAYGMGDNFTTFLKLTYVRVCNLYKNFAINQLN